MSEVMDTLDGYRVTAARWLLLAFAVIGLGITAGGLFLPLNSALPGAIGISVTAFAYWSTMTGYAHYRSVVGQAGAAQALALIAVTSGTAWQIDAHMAVFVILAALIALVDVRPILLAALTIVAHHLVLAVLVPQLVFPSFDVVENLQRAVIHGAFVALEVTALTLSVAMRLKLTAQVTQALEEAKAATLVAEEAGERARQSRDVAKAEAETARTAQDETEKLLEGLRKEQAAREQSEAEAKASNARNELAQKSFVEAQSQVVKALRGGLERIANGDLSRRIEQPFPEGYEELRHDYNRALATLGAVLRSVLQSADDLMGQVSSVAASADALANRTEQQVTSLETTSQAVHALNKTVQASTENARETVRAAGAVKADAEAGGEVVHRVVKAMSDIEASSQEIAKINAVMDGIAFQTNLLALNAGVEAARAGEAGRGFSVVASEVRALSQRATEAARGINELTERSGRQVREGVSLVGQAGLALETIVTSIEGMSDSTHRIAQAAEEQSQRLDKVSASVTEQDAVAQSNAAMFEETNAACQALNLGMTHISDLMRDFQLGSDSTPAPRQDNAVWSKVS